MESVAVGFVRDLTTTKKKNVRKKPIFTNLKKRLEHIKLAAKLLDYFLRSNKSNINQSVCCNVWEMWGNGENVYSISEHWLRGCSLREPWTGWIGSAPVQMSSCSLGGALSWWWDELLSAVIVLRLPVVSGRADFVDRRRHYHFETRSAELSWRQIRLLTQSLQRRRSRRACVCAYVHVVCVCVYVCMYVCVWTCMYVNICKCICIGICMHVYTCGVYVCVGMFVHRLWVLVAVLQRVWTVS